MVYVDELQISLRNKNWPYSHHCHLVADSLEELHVFAQKLGLRRSWFQIKTLPHYDLTTNKRVLAIHKGAIELTREEFVNRMRESRSNRT